MAPDKARPLFNGPRTPEALWEDSDFVDCRGVKVGTAKFMRNRPVFRQWATEVEVAVNTDVLNIEEAKKAISEAGALIGVCESRPRFGLDLEVKPSNPAYVVAMKGGAALGWLAGCIDQASRC